MLINKQNHMDSVRKNPSGYIHLGFSRGVPCFSQGLIFTGSCFINMPWHGLQSLHANPYNIDVVWSVAVMMEKLVVFKQNIVN